MTVKQICIAAVFLTFGIIIPFVCGHAFSIPGTVLLPMHLTVFIGAMILGPRLGGIIGFLTPILSCMLTGMPNNVFVYIMTAELTTYGLIAGFLCKTKKLNVYLSLIISMIIGRCSYALMLFFLSTILGLEQFGKIASVFTAITTGLPGIAIQLLIVPIIVIQLRKVLIYDRPSKEQD